MSAAASPVASRERRQALAVVAIGLVLRALVAAIAPLTTDEAYYVDWARHLAPGYLDHPPLVAWLVAGPLRVLGYHAVAVRLPAILLQAATALLAAALVRAWSGERAALAVVILLQVAPVFSVGGMLATPDAPLALAWVGTLWSLERASRRPAWLVASGAFLGVAALSKLTAGLLGVAVAAALAATGDGRRLLRTGWPWLGAAVALAVASPMLAWNAAHGWPSFLFQARHGAGGGTFSALRLLASIGAQVAYVSPVLALVAALASWGALVARGPATSGEVARTAAVVSGLPVVAFFTGLAAFTPGALPHWPAPGWLSAVLLLGPRGERWVKPVAWTGGALIAVLLVAASVPLPFATPLDELRGWRGAVEAARAAAPGARLATTHWIALGHLGWEAREPLAYVSDRPSGPTFYPGAGAAPAPTGGDPAARPGPLLVIAPDGLAPARGVLERLLGPLEDRGVVASREAGRTVRTYRLLYSPGVNEEARPRAR